MSHVQHRWGRLVLDIAPGGPVTLAWGEATSGPALVDVLTAAEGRAHVSHRFAETAVGRRLAHTGHDATGDTLRVTLRDDVTGLAAEVRFRSTGSGVQVGTSLTNTGPEPVLVLGVTSCALAVTATTDDLDVLTADSEWLGESRWARRPLRDNVPDLNLGRHGQHGRGCLAVTSRGTWSSGAHLPTAGLVDRATGATLLWQIEHNGPWRWELGGRLDGIGLALLGPTDADHQCAVRLESGAALSSVTVSLASADDEAGAVAALTDHRRALRRTHRDHTTLPVVFNDYMNTLMGDPTTAKLLPLIDAAADAGAEVFCVDAGWYDDGGAWWDSVGEWEPAQTRFPRGIGEVLGRIRDRGMTPGLWLEPEVVGVRSPVAEKLPPEAFFQRDGGRVAEHGRHHLDLRHPAAAGHLDDVVDRLVEELGVGYLKLDYNIDPGPGTDRDADSVGAGLLGHNRAHLAWLDRLLDRHPDLTLENCASGAMRMDHALLARMQLQSTSDQQDFLRYPPIAVAAPMSAPPEQTASWAYPQPEMTDEEIAFTMCTGMLGRLYLSGHLDRMSPAQRDLVRAGVHAFKAIRHDLAAASPVWPLGLPGWDDPWLSLAFRRDDVTYVGAWRRSRSTSALRLPHLRGRPATVEVLYPVQLPAWGCDWDPATGSLHLTARGDAPAARILRLTVRTTP